MQNIKLIPFLKPCMCHCIIQVCCRGEYSKRFRVKLSRPPQIALWWSYYMTVKWVNTDELCLTSVIRASGKLGMMCPETQPVRSLFS